LYILYDRSFNSIQINQAHPGGYTVNFSFIGGTNLTRDSDISTFQEIICTGISGSSPNGDTIFDYGKVFFNVLLCYKVYGYRQDNIGGNGSISIDYSLDGTNWTNIQSISTSYDTSGSPTTNSLTILAARYVRFYQSFGSNPNASCGMRIYELRLTGSGK